jgi:Na+-translocating ferredoxin:NAD+ oxidoreductase subunit B
MLENLFPSVSSVVSISVIGIAFGLVLSVAKIKLKVEKDERFEPVVNALPGANCGACGFPGCSGYATKIIEGTAPINMCLVGGSESVEKISQIMGIEAEAAKPRKARVHCHGKSEVTKARFVYDGPRTCHAANQIREGFKVCRFGCLGLGDCGRSCPFGAIEMSSAGLAVVNREKCTGCGSCVPACPRAVISMVEDSFDVYVGCKNLEKAPVMKQGCSVGCTACNRCVKACKEVFAGRPEIETAITVVNFCAVIDYTKCINCGKCAEVCPQKVIDFVKVATPVG